MIALLTGTVITQEDALLVVDVHGVGYAVTVARPEMYSPLETVTLHTYFHWNQENGPLLCGFATTFERQVFGLLLSCSGLGPKVALSILSQMQAQDIINVIALADVKGLSSLHGIGPKKAEGIILQLRDKVNKLKLTGATEQATPSLSHLKQVSDILESLNYSRPEIGAALEHVKQMPAWQEVPLDVLVRKALTYFTKQR